MSFFSSRIPVQGFNLIRWFSLTAMVSIALVSSLAAWALSAFLTDRMIRQEAELTASFVRSIVSTEEAYGYFDGSRKASELQLEAFLNHMRGIDGVLRTNVYSAERILIWSSDRTLIGQKFEGNEELDEALDANLVIHSGVVDSNHLSKAEHRHLVEGNNRFVESYVPIFDPQGNRVLGVVELYKEPNELFAAISDGVRLIWISALGTGLVLFVALFWIVLRAHRIIEAQGEKLIENESLAVVGEMGSAVAHGLRNPLASIRSSAELALGSELPDDARSCAQDIVAQVDRLEGWIRELLTYAKPSHANLGPVAINEVLEESIASHVRALERRDIAIRRVFAGTLPAVRGDGPLLRQMIGSLISNASEAMNSAGSITVSSYRDGNGRVVVQVADTGQGIHPDKLRTVFKPFYTSKPKGLGLGLPLVKRMIERIDGKLELDSVPGKGTTVTLSFPAWDEGKT